MADKEGQGDGHGGIHTQKKDYIKEPYRVGGGEKMEKGEKWGEKKDKRMDKGEYTPTGNKERWNKLTF